MYGKWDMLCFEIVEFDKDESWSASASDETCEHENSKNVGTVGLTNTPATWPSAIGMIGTIQPKEDHLQAQQ